MPEIFRGTILQPEGKDFTLINDGVMVVDGGVITAIASVEEIRKGTALSAGLMTQGEKILYEGKPIEPKDQAILPPTNNFHDHTFQPPGIPGSLIEKNPNGTMSGWLPDTLRQGEALAKTHLEKAEAMARARLKAFAEAGIGRVLQYTTSSLPAAEIVRIVADELGLKVQIGYVAMDQGIDGIATGLQTSSEEAIASTRQLLENAAKANRLSDTVVIDRFPIAVTSPTRRELARLAREFGVGYETHADESTSEIAIHKGLYQGRSIIQVLIDDGVFEPGSKVGLAHAIHTSAADMDKIAAFIASGTTVSIRACPSSNAMLGSHFDDNGHYTEFPLAEWEKRGAIITLGTDQGAGRTSSILREALLERGRHPTPKQPSYRDLLRYATLSGVQETFGVTPSLKVGDQANFIVVKLAGAEGFYQGTEHFGDMEKTAARIIEGGQNPSAITSFLK